MKQLGNLALICARRPDVLMQIQGSAIFVHVGAGPERTALCTTWDDDAEIENIIRELNFGAYAVHQEKGCTPQSIKPRQSKQLYSLVYTWNLDCNKGVEVLAVSYDKTALHSLMKEKAFQVYSEETEYTARYKDPPIQWVVSYDKQTKDTLSLSHGLRLYPNIMETWGWAIQPVPSI